jgi:hypothetical protein
MCFHGIKEIWQNLDRVKLPNKIVWSHFDGLNKDLYNIGKISHLGWKIILQGFKYSNKI